MTIIRAAATTANLGPGFDCLGLALDLWNETRFTLINDPTKIVIQGEGKDTLPKDGNNLIALAAQKVYQKIGVPPPGLFIQCHNRIPLDSGLGSSAAATLTGLLGANALLGNPLTSNDLLELGAQIEGHADNIVPALLGGLTIAVEDKGEIISRSYPPTDFK
ncbi:MAG: homoserine kinase, partial [Anaerolineae bacterium]|nr:homoserine kinase [Anaerolineae bacterium]